MQQNNLDNPVFFLVVLVLQQPHSKQGRDQLQQCDQCLCKGEGPPEDQTSSNFPNSTASQDGQWQLAIYLLLAMQQARLHPDVISALEELGKCCAGADNERSLCISSMTTFREVESGQTKGTK